MQILENRFHESWKDFEDILDPVRPLIVAVSGGVDSVVLLHLLAKQVGPSQLIVVHFDHRVRSTSGQDARWVTGLSHTLGIQKVFLGKRKGPRISEEALRTERHQFFERVLKKTKAQAVVLAHHADDQLETLLMRLIRGTRLDGLGCMERVQGKLWRPLLNISKKELMDYSQRLEISFLEDETNRSPRFFRNRIRAEVIPALKILATTYGGEEKFFKRFSTLWEEVQNLKEETLLQAQQWCDKYLEKTCCWWSFSQAHWQSQPLFIQKTLAELLWSSLVGETLETKEIRLLHKTIKNKSQTVLSGKVEVIASFEKIYLVSPTHRAIQKKLKEKGPWVGVESLSQRRQWKKKLEAQGLELRFLEPGDTFRGKKMKRLVWKEKIPSVQRPLLPVLASRQSSEIHWYFPQDLSGEAAVLPPWALSKKAT